MAYDERLAARVRVELAGHPGISERKMFGGIAFLLDGKMCCGVLGDELMVRTGKANYGDALARKHTRPMDFTGRVSTGMVYVSAAGVARGPALRSWIDTGIEAARAAPASKPRSRKAAPRGATRRSSVGR